MRTPLLLAFVAACGGGGSSDRVVVRAARAKLTVIRTGTTWTTVNRDVNGDATLDLDGPTMIASVCDDPGYFNYYTIYAGPGSEEVLMMCPEPTPSVTVMINVVSQTTRVYAGINRTLGGTEMLEMTPGTYDFVAVDTAMTPARFEIRRKVVVSGAMAISFDLAQTGTPMVQGTVTVTGAGPGETPSQTVSFTTENDTANDTFASWSATTAVWLVPETNRIATDRLRVGASTSSELMGARSVRRTLRGETTATLALAPYLTTLTPTWGANPAITLQGGPRINSAYYGVNDANFTKLWDVAVLPEWQESGGDAAITIPDPSTIPNWQSQWNLPIASTGLEWFFSASEDNGTDTFSVSDSGAF